MASRRRYLTVSELEEYADITVSDSTEADDQISHAEEIIDAYVGPQDQFYPDEQTGKTVSATTNTLTLQTDQQNVYENDFYKWCEIEIVGKTGEGQHRTITGSTKAGVLTVDSNWTSTPDSTSYYRIYQLGKFPRQCDVNYYSTTSPYVYLKTIPDAVKRAIAAQVEFFIQMGSNYFSTDIKESESIGDYSYSNASGQSAMARLIAPKAKALLQGIKNRTGVIERT